MVTHEQSSLEEELLNLIANQLRFSPYNMVLSMAIIAYIIYGYIPEKPWIWGGWMLLVIISQLYRMRRLPRLPLETDRPVQERTREASVINFSCTFIQGLCFIAFPFLTPFEAAMITMIFLGMGVGSIVSAVGWAPYTLTHIWVSLMPLFGLWAWSGVYGEFGVLGILLALIGVSYSNTMWFISKRLYEMNEKFFENRAALALALNDAELADAAKTRFLAAASHDLRQPIHSLSLFSAALRMRQLDDRARHISESMDEAIQAMSSQLDALLDVSKLDAGVVNVEVEPVNLSRLLKRLNEDLSAAAKAVNIKVQIDCPENAIAATDPMLIERILRNLMTNAIAHNSDCELVVTVARKDQKWQLQVADNGTGIAADEQERIFEEFYQVHNPERDRSKGLGLGLSIVRRLSKLLNAGLTVRSSPGAGTSFTLLVPVDIRHPLHEEQPNQAPARLDGIKVLVVDDEGAVRNAMQELLLVLGCEVRLAEDVQSALLQARSMKPDIALVDFRLRHNETGLEAVARLRAVHGDLPAIVISGDTAPDRLQEARAAGLKLLSKPVAEDVLSAAIAEACVGKETGTTQTSSQ